MGLEKFIAKALRKTKYGRQATYPVFGCLPSDFQEKLADDIETKKRIFTFSQIGLATGFAIARYFFGEAIEDYSTIGYIGTMAKIWSLGSFAANSLRLIYMGITKRPVGMLSLELPYRLFKKNRKAERVMERYILE